jgi:nitrate reductase gamma subunit
MTMDAIIEFGRGAFFRFAIAVALLGLVRQMALTVIGVVRAHARAGDRRVDWWGVVAQTFVRLNPLRYFHGPRWVYSILSQIFHVGLILVPIFYAGHIRLWERGLGFGWFSLPAWLADGLTLLTIATAVGLLVARAASQQSRAVSRMEDWAVMVLILVEFATGYLLGHPHQNPFSLDVTMLVHVYCGDVLLILTPFSKIVHCIMLPFSQFVCELGWRLVPGVGREVVKTLGKEGKPI